MGTDMWLYKEQENGVSLYHDFVENGARAVIHLIKLVNTANSIVTEDQRSTTISSYRRYTRTSHSNITEIKPPSDNHISSSGALPQQQSHNASRITM